MITIDDCIRKLHSLRHLRDAEDAIQFAIEVLKEKKELLGAQSATAGATAGSSDAPREACINPSHCHEPTEDTDGVEYCMRCGLFAGARNIRPLFIALNAAYFEAFLGGRKTDELRRYGPRWNERTCAVGRPVILSKGYGATHRLSGRIRAFKKQHGSTFGSTYKAAILDVFCTLDIDIACISIDLPQVGSHGNQSLSEASGPAQSEAQ
jgi:hypothetical protein